MVAPARPDGPTPVPPLQETGAGPPPVPPGDRATAPSPEPPPAVEAGSATCSVLLVDHDTVVRRAVARSLTRAGCRVSEVATGEEGLRLLAERDVDAVCLDVLLPGRESLALCRAARECIRAPIVVVIAFGGAAGADGGLRPGADDRGSSPVTVEGLAARLATLLRRTGGATGDVVRAGPVEVHTRHDLVLREGRPVELTRTECRLLCELASSPRRTFSREELLESVWGYDRFVDRRLVDVHVGRLRRKVESNPAEPEVVLTVRGSGYRLGR